jgi:hypothetical protein
LPLAAKMPACMEAARAYLKAFIKKAAKDSVQFMMALVKSHDPEADLHPVGKASRRTTLRTIGRHTSWLSGPLLSRSWARLTCNHSLFVEEQVVAQC